MKNLFDPAAVSEIKARLSSLSPESRRQWGKMSTAQAMAHCSAAMELATGDRIAPRVFVGRLIGRLIKPLVLRDDAALRRNTGTIESLMVRRECDLSAEKSTLSGLVDRFAEGGPTLCTTHPHSFFGRLTPDEWAVLMYKHLDHHLRQFGA